MYSKLSQFKNSSSFIFRGDERLLSFRDNPTYKGDPEALVFARDLKDLSEVLEYCNHEKIPCTAAGSQSSLVASSTSREGLLIAFQKQNKILDFIPQKNGEALLKTQPGVLLGDLKKFVWDQGYFYPPDPTSYREAQVGGTIATNATGEDTYYYGPTRAYVEALEVCDVQGSFRKMQRNSKGLNFPPKNRAGYYMGGEEIDEIIGSEGTLAFITEMTLRCIPKPYGTFSLLLPFKSLSDSIEFVICLQQSQIQARTIELIGPGAYQIFTSHQTAPSFPKEAGSLIYIKQNYNTEKEKQFYTESYLKFVENFYKEFESSYFMNDIFYADSRKQKEEIRIWRHYVPAKVNEKSWQFMEEGGGKISTDWWVPQKNLHQMMCWNHEESLRLGVDFLVFGHIGNGHPHWNYLAKNAQEFNLAKDLVRKQCEKVVRLEGGLAGEHGVGKIHHDYIDMQCSPEELKKMIQLKRKWDPHWILGRGNILKP